MKIIENNIHDLIKSELCRISPLIYLDQTYSSMWSSYIFRGIVNPITDSLEEKYE